MPFGTCRRVETTCCDCQKRSISNSIAIRGRVPARTVRKQTFKRLPNGLSLCLSFSPPKIRTRGDRAVLVPSHAQSFKSIRVYTASKTPGGSPLAGNVWDSWTGPKHTARVLLGDVSVPWQGDLSQRIRVLLTDCLKTQRRRSLTQRSAPDAVLPVLRRGVLLCPGTRRRVDGNLEKPRGKMVKSIEGVAQLYHRLFRPALPSPLSLCQTCSPLPSRRPPRTDFIVSQQTWTSPLTSLVPIHKTKKKALPLSHGPGQMISRNARPPCTPQQRDTRPRNTSSAHPLPLSPPPQSSARHPTYGAQSPNYEAYDGGTSNGRFPGRLFE